MMGSSKMPSFGIIILTTLLVFTEAGPVNKLKTPSTCAVQCPDNHKFDYQPGTVYEFSYDAKTTTKMNGASEDSASITMNAKVEIEPITKCDLVMRIKDASLRDSEDDQNSQAFKEAMMKQPLKFSFQDGRIDHICAMEGESTWTLNIKRGILSAFQNSMDSFDRNQNLTETDVVGACDSEYKILDEGRKTMIVKKTKNLLGCSDREGYRFAIQSIGYNVPLFVKSLPLIKSEYKCTQTLDLGSNILQSSTCSEEHVFRPFSYGKNGAMTTSEQTLTFINKRRAEDSSNEQFNQRSTLLFHHQHNTESKQEKEEKIEAKLQELCQKAAEDIRPEVPEMVNQLIEHMRQVDRDVLSKVYKKINQKKICAPKADNIKQYFHDAIPMVGTAASVGMIQDLISKKHVTGSEAEMWLLSLSFVHHPTREMVAAASPLLGEPDVSGNTLLAVSSLASSYCNVRPDCGKDSEISALIGKLMELTNDCNVQNGDARRIVFALRALGNIGHSHVAVSHLTRCSTRRDVPEEIRIAAMDAFRRVPCDAMRSDLMGVFRDESEDSELRLNAYIALMKCPSQNVLSEVRQVLEKEKSNQVGSFVWSHLTNLMETSDPHMQDIRNIIQDEELKKEFNLDQRKFSRNYEGSFFLDSINTGAKVDSNVIFSEKSFIPRSANLNLTIDLFGHAINFLEFGGRVQGMERILENFFGPTGLKEPKKKTPTLIDFDKSMDQLRASAFLRVFGNELRYWDDKSLNELQSSLRKLMNMQALSFSKSMQLLDSRMIIPTCVGLPLSLTMSATGSISLDAKASFQRSELNVDIKPSASVQVKGEMSVDAHVSRAGLKMVTVAHTSTGATLDIRNNKFDLQIPKKKMEIFNLKTDFYIIHRNTEKKQKMIVDNVQKHEVCTGNLMKQVTGLTFCQIIKFPNASLHNEAPFFPFTGPVVYDLYMMNEDAPNGYQIEGFTKQSPYSFYIDTPNSKVSRRIALDTVMKSKNEARITIKAPWKNIKLEGTVVNVDEMKKLTAKLSLNERTDYTFNAELGMKNTNGLLSITPTFEITVPQKKMKYEGKIEVRPMKTLMIDMSAMGFIANDINLKVSGEIIPKEIGLTTQLRIGKEEYYISSRLGKLVSKSGFKYTPSLKITIPNEDLVEFTSEILYEANKKMSFDFKLNKVLPKTVAMNAIVLLNAGKTKTKHILRILFKSPRGTFRINGDMDNQKTGITSRVIGSYNFGAKCSDHLTLSSKIRDLSVKSMRYMGNIALTSKKQQFLNFNLKGQLAKAINHLETKFDLHYGNPKIKTNNLKFACVLNRTLKPLSHTYDYTMSIQHPGQKIDYRIEIHQLQSATWPFKKFENTMTVQSASENVLKTSLSYNNGKEKGLPCYKVEASLSYPGRDMKVSEKVIQSGANSFANYLNVQTQKGNHFSVYSSYNKTKTGIYNTEMIVSLAGEKEIKFNGMIHATPGAYKAKVSVEADPGLISNERIHYMTKAGLQYKLKATQVSTDASFDMLWAEDKNISGSFNLKYTQGVSLSSRLLLLTSSDILKSFDSKMKWGWGKNKFSAVVTSSLNNKISIKQDFSYTYPNLQLAYTSHVDFLGKTSDVAIDLGLNDSSFNGTMKISKDKEIISDIALRYTGHKSKIDHEIQLRFTVFATGGKINMNTKFDLKKQMLELNGSAKLNLPLQKLRQIGASCNLKHNRYLSSIDMTYSSSLENYRNGKMTIKMKRNLPKMFKATMDMTLDGKPMFNVNANYGRQRDNIDMKVDITEANGQKTTVSANINFSGSRKTGNVEIKSRYINFSAEGALEYQGTRSAGGELKLTADGRSVMIRANYKKEGSTYKVTGTLGLPDGRSLKMEGSLDLQNIAASLKTMTPDFPELTEVDMAFTFKGDKQMLSNKASLKMMPYFDTTQFEVKFTKKQFSIEMKTRFESMKQAKVTVTFDGDLIQSQQVKAIFQLNNKQMVDLDINYDFNSMSDFAVSMTALTSHMRYKEFQFDLKNKGPLSNMQSSLKLKLANILMLDAMFLNSKKAIKTSLEAQLLDFDEWKSTFVLKGNLDAMTAKMITSIAKKEVNRIDVNIKEYGRMITVKVNGPKAANFDFNMNIDTEAITLNMASTFTLNGREKYEVSASYEHLSKLQIKSSIPSYQDDLLVMFSGKLKAFNMQTKFSHNNAMYELMLSNKEYYRQVKGVLNTPYFQDTASFKFDGEPSQMNILIQVMHNKDKYELTFSNSGYYQQIDAKLDTPYFQPTLKCSLIGNLNKFNIGLKIQSDKQVYEMKASNEDYFRQMNFLLDTPFLNCDFRSAGDLNNAKATFTVLYSNTKYEVSFTHAGSLKDMQTTLYCKLDGEEQFKSKFVLKGYGATISAMMKSPNTLDFEFESEWDMENVSFNLRSSLGLQHEKIYKIAANYEHAIKLHVKTLILSYGCELTMSHGNENANLKLKLGNVLMLDAMFLNSKKAIKTSLEAQLLDFDEWKSTFVLKGNLDAMTAKMITSIAKKEVNRIDVNIKEYGRMITVKVNGPKAANFDFNMNIDTEAINLNMASTFTLNGREKYEVSASYEHLSKLQIKSSIPSYQDDLLVMFSGKLKAFNMQTKFSHNNAMYELMLSNKEYYRQVKGVLNTPYFQDTASFKFDGEPSQMNILIQVMHNKDKYELTFSNSGYYQQIDAKLVTPYSQPTLKCSLIGNLNKFNIGLKIQSDKQVYEMKASNEDYFRLMNFLLDTPFLNCDFRSAGDLDNAKATFTVLYSNTKYEVSFTHAGSLKDMQTTLYCKLDGKEQFKSKFVLKGYGATISAMMKSPNTLDFEFESEWDMENVSFNLRSSLELQQEEIYKIVATYEHLAKLHIKTSFSSYRDELTMTLNGDLKMFNALAKLTHNTSKYELIISNQGYYRKVDAQLVTPFFTDMASLIFNGDEKAFTAQAKFMHDNDQYELVVSNRNHYQQMIITLSTPFSSDKLDIDFKGDLSSFESVVIFSHNKVEYKLEVSNEGYYRKINAKLATPSFQTEALFKLKGNLQTFNSMAEFIFNEKKFALVLSNKDYYKQMSVKLITPFSNNSLLISFDGSLNSFNAKLKYMNFKDLYELVVYNSGYYREIEAKLSTPYFRDMLSISVDGKLSDFTVRAKVMHNHENYQMTISNVRYYRKLSVELTTPFYEGSVEFSLKGNLQTFNMITKVMHNKDIFQLTVSTVNYYRQMKAGLTAPFYEGSVEFSLDGNLNSFNAKLKYTHFKNQYQLFVSNSGYYRNINVELTTPVFHKTITFNVHSYPESFNFSAEFKQNRNHYTLAVIKEKSSFELNANVTGHSVREAIHLTFNGNLKSFNILARVLHKNEKFQLTTSTVNYYRKITTELITPFYKGSVEFLLKGNLQSFNMITNVMHNNEKFQLTVSTVNYYRKIKTELATPFYKGSVQFSLKGNQQSFNMITNVMHNNEKFQLTVSTVNYYRQIKGELTSPFYDGTVDFSLKGNLQSFNMTTKIMHNNSEFQLTISTVNYYRQIKAELTTSFYKGSVEFLLKGNLQSFNMITNVLHNNEKSQFTISTINYYRQIKAKLTTPFYEGSVEFSLKGNLQSFNMVTKVMHNKDMFQLSVSTVDYYRQIKTELTTPYFKDSVDFSLTGNLRKFNAQLTLKHNDKVYEMKATNREFYRQMNLQLTTPFLHCGLEYSIEMAKTFFIVTIGKDKYEVNISSKKSFQFNDISLSTPQHKLKISSKIYHKKKSISGVFNVQLDGRIFTLSGIYKNAKPKYIFNANFKSPYFTATLQSSSLDKNRKMPANQQVSLHNYIYEALTENSYNELDFNLKRSGMKMKFSFKGNLQKCKVVSNLKEAAELYEINFSNQKYFQNINIEVSAPETGLIKFNYNFQINANHFDLDSMFSHGSNRYVLSISSKIESNQYVAKLVGPEIIINGKFNGDLKSFSFHANAVFNKQKYEVMASAKNYFREIAGKLTTPQFGEQSLSMKINGQLIDFSGSIEVKNNKEIYRSEFSLKNQEFHLSLPKWLKKLQVKLNGNLKNFEFIVLVLNYNGEKFEISATNKNFKEMKAHLAIPQLDDIDVSIKTSGNLRKGDATLKISYGENIFENELEVSFDGKQATFGIEPHYKIFGRSGKAKLQFDLRFEDQSYKYEFEADVEGNQVKSMASVKISPEISASMTVSIPTLDASEMKLRIVSRGFQKTDMMLNLKSPWTGMTKIFYEHNCLRGKSISTKGYIEKDGIRLAGYSFDIDFPNDYSFDFRCDYGNSENKIETKGYLKFHGVKTVATLSINTPFRVFKEFFVAAQTKMMRDGQVKAELDVKLPNQQYSLNIDSSNGNSNVLLNLNMDKTNKDKQYQFQTSYKNTDQQVDTTRSFNFKMILPERTMSLDSRFENSQNSMVMTGDIMLGEAKDQKSGFELMVQKGDQKEGKLKIITPRRTVELFGRLGVNGNHYSTVGHIMMDEKNQAQKVDIKADMMILSDKADIDLTVKFPNQKKGMNLKTSVNLPKGDIIFSSTSEFSMDQDPKKTFKISTKLMSETKGKRQMYTMQMDAGHAQSGFATEVVGRVSSSPEKYNADVEMGYLTSKRQQQKLAIRGEMHRFNREVNLKLEAPSKTIELDGALRTGNRFIMSILKKESGKENMEAVFKLNPKSQRMNIIFNYDEENPDNVYRIDVEIMESKTLLKAYRSGKQSNLNEDLHIYAELKPRILKSGIRWNPHLLQDFNVFAYQKLSMYGKELKSFGDSLSQVINKEVSMKFALAKQSFSEDIAPISDYFVTEYRSLSADFARAMHHMNQMFEQDSFYIRSAVEAISNVWDEMWLNFNEYLVEMKQEIEVYNRNMNHKMDEAKKQFDFYYGQYSMQLKNKSNELSAYYQEHYEILYENAMKMKAEIVSLVENYPETIKDIIDHMRQSPYGKKVIVFLTEMYEAFNEKTVQAQEHIDTLTSAIYSAHATLNLHIATARRYPIVDAIMDSVNKVYQQALWSYNYWNVKDNVLGLKSTLYKFGAKKIKEIKNIITDVGMNTLIFDPKRGEIIVEIRFGAAKYFYNHFMSSVEDVERAVMKLKNLMPSFNLNVWDIYYMMKPSSDLDDYISPFKAEATIFAGQHITTFDGRHLNYKGTCGYLLARDFVDGNFTVVANFDADRKAKTLKSLSVTTAHNEQLEIFPDNKVLFNRRDVKLPLQLTDATVTLQGNLIVLESKRGYKVLCDHDLQLYTMQINGWYFNKVAGLFGNYNNEPRDDMLMSNTRYTNDLEQFAQSWSVSRQCKSHRNAAPSHMVTENRDCAQFFLQTDSPFRYCFRQVNPDQFYKTCAMQLSSSKATSIDLCKIASFYHKKCEMKGVYLSMPVMCPKKM